MKTSVQELEFTIEKEKFAANLKDACQKIAPKIKSLVQIFEVMITKVPAEKAMMTPSKRPWSVRRIGQSAVRTPRRWATSRSLEERSEARAFLLVTYRMTCAAAFLGLSR
jgi:hypothetical protein